MKTREIWSVLEPRILAGIAPEEESDFVENVCEVTTGAAAHRLDDLLKDLQTSLYESMPGWSVRIAYLASLPAELDFAERWSQALACEDETVFLSLSLNLGAEKKEQLKELVPDLLDLLG